MYDGYKKWITPNPDIMCNSEVKFKVFLEEALEHGFDGVAMWHYSRILKTPLNPPLTVGKKLQFKYSLLKWLDNNKDQSYFLAWLNQFQLSKALFPIGELEKPKVREIALEAWLPNAKRKDSQGICFVWKVDLTKFLEKKINPKPGIVMDTSGKILGKHKWVFYYTIGQRKWLDIWGQPEPIFIVRKDIEKNEIIVWTSKNMELFDDKLLVSEFHYLWKTDFEFPLKAKCKIRYRQADQECVIYKEKERFRVEFKEKQRAIASWQICAVYLEDDLVMSGVIN
jgi:tRNA-specific 2-thiouridylase